MFENLVVYILMYPPPHGLKTWRIYPGSPTKLMPNASDSSMIMSTTGRGDGNGRTVSDGPAQPVIEISSSTSSVTEI